MTTGLQYNSAALRKRGRAIRIDGISMNEPRQTSETVSYQGGASNPGLRWDDSVRHVVQHQIASLPKDERLNWIRSDQRQRWQKGSRVPIEAYLELAPL